MIYRGKLIDGKIVFERPPELPEGQEVEVRPVESVEQANLRWLQKFAGIVKESTTDDSVNRLPVALIRGRSMRQLPAKPRKSRSSIPTT